MPHSRSRTGTEFKIWETALRRKRRLKLGDSDSDLSLSTISQVVLLIMLPLKCKIIYTDSLTVDLPIILSDKSIVFLDPHEKINPRKPGIKYELKEFFESDAFSGHEDSFVSYFEYDGDDEYDGTMFRFPLRNKEYNSDIKPKGLYDPNLVMSSLFEPLKQEAENILLFLKNVKSIKLFTKKRLGDAPKCIFSAEIPSLANVGRVPYKTLEDHIRSSKFRGNMKVSVNLFPISLSNRSNGGIWLVINLIGFPKCSNELSEFYDKEKLDYLPWIGIAMETGIGDGQPSQYAKMNFLYDWDGKHLDGFINKIISNIKIQFSIPPHHSMTPNSGKMFCFLPSPEDSHFPFHLHGYFALSNDRRRIKWPTLDSTDTDSKWNRLLVEGLGVSAYAILHQILVHCFHHPNPEKYHYQLMGDRVPKPDSLAGILVNQGLTKLMENQLLYSQYREQWLHADCVLHHPSIIYEQLPYEKSILHVLKLLQEPLVTLPGNLIEIFNSLPSFKPSTINTIISPTLMREILKERCDSEELYFLSFREVNELLSYIISDLDFGIAQLDFAESLENIPLLISESNKIYKFETLTRNSLYIYESAHDYVKLFPGLEDQFVNREIQSHSFLLQLSREYLGIINLLDISNLADKPDLLIRLFKSSLKKTFHSCEGALEWNYCNPNRINWIRCVWSFIGTNFNQSLRNLPLLPKNSLKSPKNQLLPINTNNIYIQCSSGGYDSIEALLEKSGCTLIHPHNFIECFEELVTQPLPRGLLLALQDKEVLRKFVFHLKNRTNSGLVPLIITILTGELRFSHEQIRIIKQLPIFRSMSGPEHFIPLSNNAVRIPDKFDLPPMTYPEHFLSPDNYKANELYNCLGISCKNINTFVQNDLVDFMDKLRNSRQVKEHDKLSRLLLQNIPRFSERLISLLKDTQWIVDSNVTSVQYQVYHTPNELFNPDDEILKKLLPSNSRFFPRSEYPYGVRKLVNCSTELKNQSLFEEIIKVAVQNFEIPQDDWELWRRQFLILLEFLKNSCFSTKHFLSASAVIKKILLASRFVLPYFQRPSNYPKCFPFKARRELHNIDSVIFCSEEEMVQIAGVRVCVPLFKSDHDYQFSSLLQHFNCETGLTGRMLSEQLYTICTPKIGKESKSEREKIHKIVNQIYSSPQPMSIDKNLEFIYLKSENTFIRPSFIVHAKLKFQLEPFYYYFDALSYNEETWKLFEKCGASQNITPEMLYGILQQMYSQQERTHSQVEYVDMVIYIIEYLYAHKFKECEFLLGQDCKLHLSVECLFTDSKPETIRNRIEKDGQIYYFVHIHIPIPIADYFGAKSLKFTLLGDEDRFSFCKTVGQFEELTTRLHSIIHQYESSIDVFKELVQNADDAKASTVRVLFDYTTYPSNSLLDSSMEVWQGPALYFYNNSEFRDEDFENIMKIFGQTKLDDLDKIGKFGLGFNTVYHLTDLPSFVSGDNIIVLDPHTKYIAKRIRKTGICLDFVKNKEGLMIFQDQFCVFNLPLFKCNVFNKKRYNGTLFRLPFRTEVIKSNISKNVFKKKQIGKLLSHIIDESEEVIRFLQYVNCIEVFERKNGTTKEVKLLSVTKKVISNPLKQPFLTENCKHFQQLMEGCYPVSHISQHQTLTISRVEQKIKSEEDYIISYASGTDQCLDFIKENEDCRNYPFCSILLPISIISSEELSEERTFNLYSFLPLPITSPYHSYYINGCFELDNSRRGIASTEDGSAKTRWNQSLINDALVNALLCLLVSVQKHCSTLELSKYYALWPHERCENRILWKDFPLEFANRVMDSNLPVFYFELGEEKWRSYGDVVFIQDEDYYDHEHMKQFLNLIKDIAFRLNILLVEIPKEYKNSYIFQIIYENRDDKVYTLELICNQILFPRIGEISLKQLKLVLHTLLPIVNLGPGGWAKELLTNYKCIPCGTKQDNCLQFPSRVVYTHSMVAGLYCPGDKRTIHPDFSEFMKEKTPSYKALKILKMIDKVLPCEDLIERCGYQVNLTTRRKQHCLIIIKYLNSKLTQSAKSYTKEELEKIKETLLGTELLPIWKNELLVKLGLQSSEKFASPNQCFPFSLRLLIPSCYFALTEEVDNIIESPLKTFLDLNKDECSLDLDDILSLLESLCEREKEIIDLNIQSLVTPICENIYSVLFNRWENEIEQEATTHEVSSIKEILQVWHPTHRIFKNVNGIVSTRKYEDFKCKYLMSFPYKLPADQESLDTFYESINIRKDITSAHARDIIQEIADDFDNGPIPTNEAELIIQLTNSLFVKYETSNEEEMECLLLSSELMLCHPDELMIDDMYLQGENKKSKSLNPTVHDSINPRCAFNLGARSIRSKWYTKKDFKVSDFGQHEEITDRIESLKRGYPAGVNILKELIQNAEDAGATEMSLMLDYQTSHKNGSLCFSELEHPEWHNYQTYPSLLFYNNSQFTEEDLEGIQCVGLGGKKNRNTIGKFGLGFNAVYHLTKSPCLLTRNNNNKNITFCVFDPYRRFLNLDPKHLPGLRLDFKDDKLLKFPDQFEPYSLFSKLNKSFPDLQHGNYSIFRIPLMSTDVQSVYGLLSDILLYSTKLNLFLEKIHTISIYTHDKHGKISLVGRANTETRHSSRILPPISSPNQYVKNINVCLKEISVKSEIPSTPPTCTSLGKRSKPTSDLTTRSWLIFNSTGSVKDLEGLCPDLRKHSDIFEKEKLTEVFGGLAVEIPQSEDDLIRKEGASLFSYLPIERNKSDNNFPIQVNAPFILESERQYIRFSDTSMPLGEKTKWEDVWHSAVLEHVLTPLFASLLLYLKHPTTPILKQLSKWEKYRYYEWYYSLYPNLAIMIKDNNNDNNFHYAMCKRLYTLLYKENGEILIDMVHKKWFHLKGPERGVFKHSVTSSEYTPSKSTPVSHQKRPKLSKAADSSTSEELFSVLTKLRYPLTCAPACIADNFEKFGCEIKRVDQTHFLSFINTHKHNLSKNNTFPTCISDSVLKKTDIEMLLNYLLKATNDKIESYCEIPLKIDFTQRLNVFTKSNASYFPKYAELLPHHKDLFISSEFPESCSKKLSNYGFMQTLESDSLALHLISSDFNLNQVSLFWEFILTSKTPSHDISKKFGSHSLIPVRIKKSLHKLTQIINLPSILNNKAFHSENALYVSLVKLNCPLLDLQSLSPYLADSLISELESYLKPLIISISISCDSFLNAVKLSGNNSIGSVNFEQNEANSLKNLFSSCNISNLDMSRVEIIGSLKMFISDTGALCSVRNFKNCFINGDCVPIDKMLKKILQDRKLGIFKVDKNNHFLIESISKRLNIELVKVEVLFSKYIIPNFLELNLIEQQNLLKFISKISKPYKLNIVRVLRSLKFISKPLTTTKYTVSEFYSPRVKLFKLFFPDRLLPCEWCVEECFDIFYEIGLVHKESLELVVEAALQIQNSFHPQSEEVTNVLTVLVSLLKSKTNLNMQEKSCLTKLASIPFLPVWKIVPSKSGVKGDLARFNEANLSKFKNSCCTTSYIHRDEVSQISELNPAASLLNIQSEPRADTVIDHLETISKEFSLILKYHQTHFPQLFYDTYKYLQQKNSLIDIANRFQEINCILYENTLYFPRNMVFNLDFILSNYLFKVPDALKPYKSFLKMVGVEESPTFRHYSSVLCDINADINLNPVKRAEMGKKTFLLFIESLRKYEASNSTSKPNLSGTFVLTDETLIVPIDEVVYIDNTRLKIHLQDFTDLSQLLFLCQLPPNELGSSEPPALLNVKYLSKIIEESIKHLSVLPSPKKSFHREAEKIDFFLKSPEFTKGLFRIYYKSKSKGQEDLRLIRIKNRVAKNIKQDPSAGKDASFKTIFETLQDISVKIVDTIPIEITNCNTHRTVVKPNLYFCFFQDSVLYARGGMTSHINFFNDLTCALNMYLGNIFSDVLFSLQLCFSSFDCTTIMDKLDSYNIPICPFLDEIEFDLPLSIPITSLPTTSQLNPISLPFLPTIQPNPLPTPPLTHLHPTINPSAGITRSNLIQILHTPKPNIPLIPAPPGSSRLDKLTARLWIRTAQCDLLAAKKLIEGKQDDTFPPHACANCFECGMKICIAILSINKYNQYNISLERNLDILLDLVKNFLPSARYDLFRSHCIPLINFDENAKNPCMTPGIGCCIPMDFISLNAAEKAIKHASKLLEIVREALPAFEDLMFNETKEIWEHPTDSLLMSQLEDCKFSKIISYLYLY